MRVLMILPLAAAIALAGCGKKSEAPAGAGASVAPTVGGIVMPVPGEYKQTIEMLEVSIPGMPASVTEQMKSRMSAATSTTDCLTPEESKEALKQLTKGIGKGECTYSKYNVGGGRIDAVMNCDTMDGAKSAFTMNGTFGATGSDITAVVDQTNPAMPGGAMHMKMHMVSQRIGECKAS